MKFFVVLGVLVLAIAADATFLMHNPYFCYITDPIRSITVMHGETTSYEALRRYNMTTVNPAVSTCTPSRFWYLGRYGGRLPHLDLFEDMLDFIETSIQADIISNYEAGKTSLCKHDFEAIRDWTIPAEFDIRNASFATASGVLAMQNIARRYQQNFPHILTETYNADRFYFRHAALERTNTSIRAFASGLFGQAGSQDVVYDEDIPEIDWLLTPFEECPAHTELNDFRDSFFIGPEMNQMLNEVNRKLGFHSNPLNLNTVLTMWQWCRFETAAKFEVSNNRTGGNASWCAPFSVTHHLLFEFWEDLWHFYYMGYGVRNQRLLQNLSCGVKQDLLIHMLSNDTTDQIARIFVTTTQVIQSLLVSLDVFRDTYPPHQHNYGPQFTRQWAATLLSPLGQNLAVVRYDCDDGDHDLYFILNERPLLVPGCDQETGLCKLSFIVNLFQRYINANCEASFCSDD